ncbi:unnamed protein product [Lepeophtheirus salmonis]|uniref:(salmon louse) hypothetical protein n=1 Tax=Lepeophtheirus salmonis TaxID=72036 RepID=A0A7R8CYK8_LEPSM|nr:unnamed protein product [Lepeophtheirus salmonis]CAF2970280.1 unnamed protein product [Lepeophtheirus salmonis]
MLRVDSSHEDEIHHPKEFKELLLLSPFYLKASKMQDRATENSGVVVDKGKEPFLMSATGLAGSGASAQNLGKRIVKRRRSEDSGGSSSDPRSISPMDLTSKGHSSSSSGQHSPQDLSSGGGGRIHHEQKEEKVKRRRLDDILHRKFPSSSPTTSNAAAHLHHLHHTTPLSSRKRKHPESPCILSEEEEDPSVRAGRFLQLAALMNRRGHKILNKKVNINNNTLGDSTPTPFGAYTSPEARQKIKSTSFNLSSLLSTPSSPSSATSSPVTNRPTDITPPSSYPEPASSPASSPDEEPRHKRAPRALTGRHVRPGTGASPRTLALLRQKIQERLRLREEAEACRKPPKKSKKSH